MLRYGLARKSGQVAALVAAGAVLAVPDSAWGQDPPAAPMVEAVHPGDRALTVVWSPPSGVTGITAYDARVIATAADETVDSNWTVVDDIGTGESRSIVLAGLTNGTGYDIQVRAVTDADGTWSATVAGTPTDPGEMMESALELPVDTPIGGYIEGSADLDLFEFTVSERMGVVLYTTGDYHTEGTAGLLRQDGSTLAFHVSVYDVGSLAGQPNNFLIAATVDPGTYYLLVNPVFRTEVGSYVVHFNTVRDTTGTGDAEEVELDGVANGAIDPGGDEDYFQFSLDAETDVVLRAGPFLQDTVGELLDSSSSSLATNDDGYVLGSPLQFLIRRQLAAGTYYVKIKAYDDEDKGFYSFHVETVTEPGSTTADALPLDFGGLAAGRIGSSTDADYFKIDLAEATHVFARAVSNTVDIDGAVVDAMGDAVEANVFEQDFTSDGPMGFTLADRLDAGTHYLKITRSAGDTTGGYAIRMIEDEAMDDVVTGCSSSDPPFSDPLSECQWYLKNTGQLGGTSGQDINVEDVWTDGNMGAGIGVAVVDDGLHEGHPDLIDNVDASRGHDYTQDGDGLLHPFDSHGTAVAGIVAARDNSLGVRGVAPRATVYGYNLLQDLTDANEADAMTRNMATTGVSNNSWGFPFTFAPQSVSRAWETAIETGIETGYGGKGVVYVWAVGNDAPLSNANFDSYTNFYGVTAVCVVNDRGVRTAYSEQGANLWTCAPSGDSRRSRPPTLTTVNYGRYEGFQGSSAATPTVSGVMALLRAENAALTWRDVKLILAASARKNDASNSGWRTGARKYGASGNYNFNHEYGFGVVDAKAAVDLADGWENLPPFIETEPVETAPNVTIPDATYNSDGDDTPGTPVTSTLTVGDEVEFIEFVEIVVDFWAPWFRDLRVELVSPTYQVSTLAHPWPLGIEFNGEHRFGSARHLGEDPAGTWTLRVTDTLAADTAILRSWRLKIYGHRSTPGAPAVPSATAGQRELTVFWSAPSLVGASAVTGYDVRSIRSDAADKADSRWTRARDVWTSGTLSYTVTGLLDGTQYDVQVRGVNAKGRGAWSDSVTVETLPNRAPFAVGSITGPDLRVGDGNEEVEVSAAFEDPDMDALTYDASSSAPAVAEAHASGSRVRLTPVGAGTATITVTATDIAGSNTPAEQTFTVRVKRRRGVTLSTEALTVDEGSTNTYSVVTDTEPTGTVTVTPVVPANRNLSVDPPELEFTTGDWQIEKFVTVEAARDANTNSEPPVTISHQVSGADYGSVTAPSVRVTIVEADTSVLSVEAEEVPEGGGTVTFEVTLSRPSSSEITVDYGTSDGTARAGSDYTAASGTLTFPVSSTASRQIVVGIMDDAADEEEEETFRLTLRNARHASLAGGGATLQVLGTIEDDDDPEVEVSFGASSYSVTEGGTTDVVVRLDRDPERDLEIFLERTHHGGTQDGDYSGVPANVAFGPGVVSQQFQVAATDDREDDDGESVVLSFTSLPVRVS
ncbi:MAG: S8 family serine peptidase, partial [Holophagales bacterium]|nr:S8 family serine peptidase [Holophagales bacterium]